MQVAMAGGGMTTWQLCLIGVLGLLWVLLPWMLLVRHRESSPQTLADWERSASTGRSVARR